MATEFQERVYAKLRTLPKGKVTTYADLAAALRTSSRAIGQAMRRNPYAPTVPCHRVVASDGTIGGFKGETAGKTIAEKIRLLENENVHSGGARTRTGTTEILITDFEKIRHRW